jgi:hypothetical protein
VNLKAAGRVRSGEMKRKDRRWKATERAWKNDDAKTVWKTKPSEQMAGKEAKATRKERRRVLNGRGRIGEGWWNKGNETRERDGEAAEDKRTKRGAG